MGQAAFEFDSPLPAPAFEPQTAFEIGWDFAHFALAPPAEHLLAGSALRQGFDAGRASFGARTLAPTRHTRKWLQLRLNAWRRGRIFEGLQVTPNYLGQIDTTHCPITREALTQATCTPSDASIDRVRNDASYAAGNLVVMSTRANAAKGDADFDAALASMRRAESTAGADTSSAAAAQGVTLGAAQWARIAVLCSFVTELSHAQAAALPLLVLPPNRLRLFNPVQALQALVTRQFAQPDWNRRVTRIAALIAGKSVRRDFQIFINALLPRVIESGPPRDAQAMRWALEDAWRNPLVVRCWKRFALQIDAAQAERIVLGASALRLGDRHAIATSLAQATEGWGLAQGGYVHASDATALPRPRRPRPTPARAGALPANDPAGDAAAASHPGLHLPPGGRAGGAMPALA